MTDDESTDVLCAVRRRALSPEEREKLEPLLTRSLEARVLHYAGWAFDGDGDARADDDHLIARIAHAVAARAEQAPARSVWHTGRRRIGTLALAALALASSAAAGAGVVYWAGASATERSATTDEAAREHRSSALNGEVTSAHRKTDVAEPSSSSLPDVDTPDGERAAASATAHVKKHAKPTDPADLFRQANARRLAGDSNGAMAAYRRLIRLHPATREASVAQLSLAKLLLARGDAAEALKFFRVYSAAGGALGAEALWGESQSLGRMGRREEQRKALRRLLARYPKSAYAKAARKQLSDSAP
jgi:TolA-binding protein